MSFLTGSQAQNSDPWADFWPKMIIAIVGVVIGAAFGAAVAYSKNRAEIKKLKSESTKNAGDLLEKVNKSSNDYSTACQECTKLATSFMDLIKRNEDIEQILAAREMLCSSLMENVVPKFVQFCELSILKHAANEVNANGFVIDYVCGELMRFSDWVKVVNLPIFVSDLGKAPARIAAYKLDDLRGLLKNVPKSDRALTTPLLDRAILDFIES